MTNIQFAVVASLGRVCSIGNLVSLLDDPKVSVRQVGLHPLDERLDLRDDRRVTRRLGTRRTAIPIRLQDGNSQIRLNEWSRTWFHELPLVNIPAPSNGAESHLSGAD